jgi:hypothetical protein
MILIYPAILIKTKRHVLPVLVFTGERIWKVFRVLSDILHVKSKNKQLEESGLMVVLSVLANTITHLKLLLDQNDESKYKHTIMRTSN